MAASADVRVVGAYPDGRGWDPIRADKPTEADTRRAIETAAAVPVPRADPVTAVEAWRPPP